MPKKDYIVILFIFVIAISAGIFTLKFSPIVPFSGDSLDYDTIAQNLVKGQGFSLKAGIPTAERPPGYPFFLSFIYGVFGHNHDLVRIVQFFLLAAIGITIYLMARKFFKLSLFFSFLPSVTVVLWPYFIFYSILILTEILLIFLFILSIYFLLEFQNNSSYKNVIIAGVLLGLTMLVKPLILLLPIWLFIFLFISKKMKKASFEWKKFAVLFFVILIIISPWIIRNFLNFHTFIPITSGAGGGSPENQILSRAFSSLDWTYGSTALAPGEADFKTILFAKLKNIYLFWNPGTEGINTQELTKKYPLISNLLSIYKIVFFIILGLAFLSLKFIKRKEIFLIWIVIFYFWALHTVLYPYPRYTLPIIPLVILLAFVIFSSFLNRSYSVENKF